MSQLTQKRLSVIRDYAVSIFAYVIEAANLYGLKCRDLDDPSIEELSNLLNNEIKPTIARIITNGLLDAEANLKVIDISQGIFCINQMVKAMTKDNQESFDEAIEELRGLNLFPMQ